MQNITYNKYQTKYVESIKDGQRILLNNCTNKLKNENQPSSDLKIYPNEPLFSIQFEKRSILRDTREKKRVHGYGEERLCPPRLRSRERFCTCRRVGDDV